MEEFMHAKSIRLFGFTILTGLLGLSLAAHAGDVVNPAAKNTQPALVNMTNPAGFVTQLAVMDSGELVEQLHELRSVQIMRKQALANELEAQQFDTGDTLLALVMPGGLLYASYKKAAYIRAKKKLDEVSEQIAAYADGLIMMQARLQPVTIARLE